jgi:uncharacterized membrane protein
MSADVIWVLVALLLLVVVVAAAARGAWGWAAAGAAAGAVAALAYSCGRSGLITGRPAGNAGDVGDAAEQGTGAAGGAGLPATRTGLEKLINKAKAKLRRKENKAARRSAKDAAQAGAAQAGAAQAGATACPPPGIWPAPGQDTDSTARRWAIQGPASTEGPGCVHPEMAWSGAGASGCAVAHLEDPSVKGYQVMMGLGNSTDITWQDITDPAMGDCSSCARCGDPALGALVDGQDRGMLSLDERLAGYAAARSCRVDREVSGNLRRVALGRELFGEELKENEDQGWSGWAEY